MKDWYRISEVEEMLGVPRSTIRFYVDKGLVSAEKDSENGYYRYSFKNLRELSHLLVGRNRLHLSVDDSRQRTSMLTLKDYEITMYRKEQEVLKKIAEARRQLHVLSIYEYMFYRIKRGLGKYELISNNTFYVYSQFYMFNSKTSVIDVGFPAAVFEKEKQGLSFDGYVSMVYKRDFHLLNDEDSAKVSYTLENKSFVTTVIHTSQDLSDPKLLVPALNWAKRNGIRLQAPHYMHYLTELADEEGQKQFYYELFLTVKEETPSDDNESF